MLLVLAYPVYLVWIAYLNCRLFRKNIILGLILPVVTIIVVAAVAMDIL